MKVNYKVIWIEDEPDDMEIQINLITEEIEKNFMKPIGFDKPYIRYEDFEKNFLLKIKKEDFSDIDLILVDYNLSDSNDRTGKDLIQKLRENGIFTDVLFYTGNLEGMERSLEKAMLDGVTFSDNASDKLVSKFKNILEKQMNLIMRISDLRGYLMDSTSDFDFVAKNFVDTYFNKLSESNKCLVKEEINKRINMQNKNEAKKFQKIEDKSKGENEQEFIKAAMDSQEYVMTVKDKIYILGLVVQLIKKEHEGFANEFSDSYDNKIIKPRNKLAHAKLQYGLNDANHIKIAKNFNDLNCDCSGCTEDNRFTRQQCEDLRKDIYNYYLIFNALLNELNL